MKQGEEIDEYVSLKEFTFAYMNLTAGVSSVVFGLYITNNSVLGISLEDTLGGVIRFEGTELLDTKRVISPLKDAPHCTTRSLTIEQRLSPGEAKEIADSQYSGRSNFEFDGLIVNIAGGARSQDISVKQLKIPRNTFLGAYPLNLLERGKRIKALSFVFGRCVQLYEPFRADGNAAPIPQSLIESWRRGTLDTLEDSYGDADAKKVLNEVTRGEPFPDSAIAQKFWLESCFVVLNDLIAKQVKEYV